MNNQRNFGLIGKDISYSFSKRYFEEKFRKLFLDNYRYQLYDLDSIEEIVTLITKEELNGFNVTIPYKEKIIPYLSELSDEAREIRAVNTVAVKNGQLIGFNTDTFGFEQTLNIVGRAHHDKALILGNGGAAKAVQYVLNQKGIPYQIVSRKAELNFDTITPELVKEHPLIIQCTPVGTFPQIDSVLPFPFEALGAEHLVIDLIYNPTYTEFIQRASKQDAKCVNGYFMLEQQAEKAWKIWEGL